MIQLPAKCIGLIHADLLRQASIEKYRAWLYFECNASLRQVLDWTPFNSLAERYWSTFGSLIGARMMVMLLGGIDIKINTEVLANVREKVAREDSAIREEFLEKNERVIPLFAIIGDTFGDSSEQAAEITGSLLIGLTWTLLMYESQIEADKLRELLGD